MKRTVSVLRPRFAVKAVFLSLPLLVAFGGVARADVVEVDCDGGSGMYTSITDALNENPYHGLEVAVTGTCRENVTVWAGNHVTIRAVEEQTAVIESVEGRHTLSVNYST